MTAPLRFASFLAPNMLPVYRFLAERIGQRLGRRVELVVGHGFDQFEQGQADLGVLCGLPYVWLADRQPHPPGATGRPGPSRPPLRRPPPLLRCDRRPRQPDHPPGGAARPLLGYNEPASHSGHTLTLYSLVRLGARPGFLGPVLQAGFHQRAIRLVAAGTVDAAAIDAQVLAIELRDHPALADRLRVIGTFGPSTIQPVVAASHLPAELTDRFTPIGDAAFDDIGAMVATIETAGWTSLTQTATSRRVHP